MVYVITMCVVLAVLVIADYISYKRGGLIYLTGDSIAINKISLDIKIKVNSIQTVDIVVLNKNNKAYYLITTYNGMKFKTTKTKVGSSKFNHAGKLFTKCGVTKFNRIDK